MGCKQNLDENGNLIGFSCSANPKVDINENIEKAPDEIIKKFCNGEPIAFGSDSDGICSIAKIYETEDEFLKDYENMFQETYDINEVVWFDVYYNEQYLSQEDSDGFFIWRSNKTLPENTMLVGNFCGIEY